MNDQSQIMNQLQMLPNHNLVNQPPQQQQQQQQMVNQPNKYVQWSHNMPPPQPQPQPPPMNVMKFPNPINHIYGRGGNWKGKKPMDINNNKNKNKRRKDNNINKTSLPPLVGVGVGSVAPAPAGTCYQPPTLFELEQQNRLKARRFYHPKKKNYYFNNNRRISPYAHAHAHAPRNTTSYLIRAKRSGGIASLVSPCPVTPAVLPTPVFSPSRESLVDMAKEEWGVDGYGSMKGFIRLRSPEPIDDFEDDDDAAAASSDSDVEEHLEVERRLDHDLSRFEMIYPNTTAALDYHNVLENRVDDQDTHIAHMEEETLILKERLYLMERELGELRRRLLCLESHNQVVEDINEEVVENDSEGLRNVFHKHNQEVDYVPRNEHVDSEIKRDDGEEMLLHNRVNQLLVKDVCEGEDNKFTDVALGQDKQDIGFVNEGLSVELMEDIKGHDAEEAQEQSVDHKEKHNLVDTNNDGFADDVTQVVDSGCESMKTVPNLDVCMEETIDEEVNGRDHPEGSNGKTKEHDEAGTQATGDAEDLINEAITDVPMED